MREKTREAKGWRKKRGRVNRVVRLMDMRAVDVLCRDRTAEETSSRRVGGDRRTVAFALKSADRRLYFLCIKCSGQLAARSWRTIIV